MVRERRWTWNTGLGWIGAGLMLFLMSLPLFEIAMPGSLICPLRRLLENHNLDHKVGIDDWWDISMSDWSIAQRQQADAKAAKWKERALQLHPNLRIETTPLPADQNAYWQLYLLGDGDQPPKELHDVYDLAREDDQVKLELALAQSAGWIQEIERIAALKNASCFHLPEPMEDPGRAEISALTCSRILLLKARLAARHQDEAQALRCIGLAIDLCDHLQGAETSNILGCSVAQSTHWDAIKIILGEILQQLGPAADLEAWHGLIERMRARPESIASSYLISWQLDAISTSRSLILQQQQHQLVDPEDTALAYASMLADSTSQTKVTNWTQLIQIMAATPDPADISPEGQEIIREMNNSWDYFISKTLSHARMQACAQAAFELIMLEPGLGYLSAEDTQRVTRDPLSGEPFVFDPAARTLDLPHNMKDFRIRKPIKLPW
ncbi:MAG TPA: hypothetical protein VFY13_06335 [Luteolibacter sp.]|nr:hypothetical protein [Luteolibacter sp.]